MPAPTIDLSPLAAATAGLTTPFAVVDLDALDANAATMTARAHGLPIRIASKSLRCRTLMDRALAATVSPWGKMHTLGAERLRELYPRFDDFLAVRDRLDPDRVFTNPYLQRVLGA